MPTKEQLTKSLEEAQADISSLHERLQMTRDTAALQDAEAKALDKMVQALQELELSESQRSRREGPDNAFYSPTQAGTSVSSPVSRVLNAAAARFGAVLNLNILTEAVDKLLATNQGQQELEELKNRWSAVEQVMYPRVEVGMSPMRGS